MSNISMVQNLLSSDSDIASSWDHRGSSSQRGCRVSPPPPALAKKPRGRPLGSRNKRSTSLVSQKDDYPYTETTMVTVVRGNDIVETVVDFARRHHVSFTVLSASGTVDSVTLCNGGAAFRLYGPFSVLALTGYYIFNNNCTLHPGATPPNLSFCINLSTSHGHLYGGAVAGRVVAGGDVSVMVCTFRNPHIFMHVPQNDVGDHNDNNDEINYNNNTADFNRGMDSNLVTSSQVLMW